jgi:hypothetical protein
MRGRLINEPSLPAPAHAMPGIRERATLDEMKHLLFRFAGNDKLNLKVSGLKNIFFNSKNPCESY